MGPHYTTIIVPIVPDKVCALKAYLRDRVNPRSPTPGALVCTAAFPFDAVETLHFCSLLVLDADEEAGIPAQLVLEATFDGARDDFLADLLNATTAGMHAVLTHCQDYPGAGNAAIARGVLSATDLDAVRAYLIEHDVGANAYFSGSFGRTVEQINKESSLRSALRSDLAGRRLSWRPMPATNAALQKSLQDLTQDNSSLRWAKDPAPVPWEVEYRERVAKAATWGLRAVFALIGAFALWLAGFGPARIMESEGALLGYSEQVGRWLIAQGWPQLGMFLTSLDQSVLFALVTLSLAWVVLRLIELLMDGAAEDPRRHSALTRVVVQIATFGRKGVLALLFAFVALTLAAIGSPGDSAPPEKARQEIGHITATLGIAPPGSGVRVQAGHQPDERAHAAVSSSVMLAVGALVALALLAYTGTSLRLARERAPLSERWESLRQFAMDGVKFLELVALLTLVLVLIRHGGAVLTAVLAELAPLARLAVAVIAWLCVGTLCIYALITALLVLIRVREGIDRYKFQPATDLTITAVGNAQARAREEGGTNLYQNHLASITYVKPGLFRLWLLKATLFLIGLLSRFWFNIGELGGIPTILSARWVVIDGGRRLIFLDNYGGGWESYLNEFIDMGAVKGLNAIWTNTFIKWPRPASQGAQAERYAFPATSFYVSEGAQAERPFKAYVRLSQVETIAWYSAYHTLSIVNINTNTSIRQELFVPLESYEVDSLVGRL